MKTRERFKTPNFEIEIESDNENFVQTEMDFLSSLLTFITSIPIHNRIKHAREVAIRRKHAQIRHAASKHYLQNTDSERE